MSDNLILFPLNPDVSRRAELIASLAALQRMRAAPSNFARPATGAMTAPLALRPLPVASANSRYGVFPAPGKVLSPSMPGPDDATAPTARAEDPVETIRREAAESGARRRSSYEDSLRTIRALYGLPDDYEPSPLPPSAA